LEQLSRCLAVPTRTKQWPDRADHSCMQCWGAQVSSYLIRTVFTPLLHVSSWCGA